MIPMLWSPSNSLKHLENFLKLPMNKTNLLMKLLINIQLFNVEKLIN